MKKYNSTNKNYSKSNIYSKSKEINDDDITWESDKFNLKKEILQGIYSYGFDKPSHIQKIAIPSIFTQKDIIAQSQSGTGKTGAFLISILQMIDSTKNKTQSIILLPTRELAKQCCTVAKILSNYTDIITKLCIGGTKVNEDIDEIRSETPHLIVGCSGRIMDLVNRKYLNIETVQTMVLDEADEMLSGTFKNQIYELFKFLNQNVQIILFSATLPKYTIDLTRKFMRDPIKLLMNVNQLTLEGISQFMIKLRSDKDKYETLIDIFDSISLSQCIIYCNSVSRVQYLYNIMKSDDYPVTYIHSNMKYDDRMENLIISKRENLKY